MNVIKNRIMIVGCNGLLGQALVEHYANQDVELLIASIEDKFFGNSNFNYHTLDITQRNNVKKLIMDFLPDIVINASGFTNVDDCEIHKELAWKVNVNGVKHLIEGCRIVDAKLVHISTDYIFDGENGPYDENAKPNPTSYYGKTKLASENEILLGGIPYLIFRTNVLYGIQKGIKTDFVEWVVSKLQNDECIRIVTDQINNATFVNDLVDAISSALLKNKEGIYNIGGYEIISRYEFSLKIAEIFELDRKLIIPILTSDLKQKAKRPLKSGLIILKAQTELNYSPGTLEQNLRLIKKQLSH